jgi:hypothetical protein
MNMNKGKESGMNISHFPTTVKLSLTSVRLEMRSGNSIYSCVQNKA